MPHNPLQVELSSVLAGYRCGLRWLAVRWWVVARIVWAVRCTQADFANKYIGGGVLCGGCVQEEIRFAECPELTACVWVCARIPGDAV